MGAEGNHPDFSRGSHQERLCSQRALTGEGLSKDTQRRWGSAGKGQAMWFWKGKLQALAASDQLETWSSPTAPSRGHGGAHFQPRHSLPDMLLPLSVPKSVGLHPQTTEVTLPQSQWNSWMPSFESVASSDFPTSESQKPHSTKSSTCHYSHSNVSRVCVPINVVSRWQNIN